MLFLLIVSVMVLIAFLIILPPLWRKRPLATADQDQRNIAIVRQRLAELKEQLHTGALTQQLYDAQLADLELALSDDLDIESPIQASSPSQGRWLAFVLMLAIPLLAASLYWALGDYRALSHVADTAATKQQQEIGQMVAGLAERLKRQPDDAVGWTMLGRSYKYMQQYPQAVEAFEHAYRLLGDQPEIMLLYADVLGFVNDGQLDGKPAELVFKALAMEPENQTGLWLGGMAKAQAGQFADATTLWKKLEGLLPPGSDAQQEVQGLLAKLVTQLQENPAEAEPKPAPLAKASSPGSEPLASPAPASIEVQVSLAADLQKSAGPNDTVFIYAQAVSGAKMPLAIVRKQVYDLPLTVVLTDAMAMMPNMKLSNFEQVKLLARISKSGNAMQQPGDLIGIIEQVALADKTPHKIVINSEIK